MSQFPMLFVVFFFPRMFWEHLGTVSCSWHLKAHEATEDGVIADLLAEVGSAWQRMAAHGSACTYILTE